MKQLNATSLGARLKTNSPPLAAAALARDRMWGAHSAILESELRIKMFGDNRCGQCGIATRLTSETNCVTKPTRLAFFENKPVLQVSRGAKHNLALSTAGIVYAWGNNASGECGSSTAGASFYKQKLQLRMLDAPAGTQRNGGQDAAHRGEEAPDPFSQPSQVQFASAGTVHTQSDLVGMMQIESQTWTNENVQTIAQQKASIKVLAASSARRRGAAVSQNMSDMDAVRAKTLECKAAVLQEHEEWSREQDEIDARILAKRANRLGEDCETETVDAFLADATNANDAPHETQKRQSTRSSRSTQLEIFP